MLFGLKKRKEFDPEYFPEEAGELCRQAAALYQETAEAMKDSVLSLGMTEKLMLEDSLTAVEKALDKVYYEDTCSAKDRKKLEAELIRLQVAVRNILE